MAARSDSAGASITPADVDDFLDRYARDPASLSPMQLLVLARAFERMGCDEQAIDCADRAAKADPTVKDEAVLVAKRVLGRPPRSM